MSAEIVNQYDEKLTALGLTPDKVVFFLNNDLVKVPCTVHGLGKNGCFSVLFEEGNELQEVHSSRIVFDASAIYVKPKVVKEAQEPKAKHAPVKVVCQFSIDDFVLAFPKARLYSRVAEKFDHEGFSVLSHVAILDDNTKANFNSYNGIIYGKLSADEHTRLTNGEWIKLTSSIKDLAKLENKLVEGQYVRHGEKSKS